jgi:serine/threonine protein kinase
MNQEIPNTETEFLVRGQLLKDYVLQEKIGEGGMGEVWSALQPTLRRKVAVKVLSRDCSENPSIVARFVQEARALSTLRHRHLVDIFAFGELPNGRPYYIMEFLEGRSLADDIDQRGPLPYAEITKIAEQTCRSLQVIHDAGVIHRDLKPDNIFLVKEAGGDTFVKLLDFGIAKVINHSEKNITRTGTIIGTPGYMSPEQFEASKDIDHRADIYSLGVVLYEMLTGSPPFHSRGEGLGSIIARQMTEAPPAPSKHPNGKYIPAALDELIIRMLSKDPAGRPTCCRDVFTEFSAIPLSPSTMSRPVIAAPASIPTPTFQNHPTLEAKKTIALLPNEKPTSRGVFVLAGGLLVGATLVFLWPSNPIKEQSKPSLSPAVEKPASAPVIAPASTASTPTIEVPKTVQLSISSEPEGASIFLNGEEKGKTPLSLDVSYGDKEMLLRVEAAGHEPWEDRVIPNAMYRAKATLKKISKASIKKTTKETLPNQKETANPFSND